MTAWSEFAAAEPDLAKRVRELFTAQKHHTMATLRKDSSPRISATEVEFAGKDLALGMIGGARRGADLRRDSRVPLHSCTADPGEDPTAWLGDAKISGNALEVENLGDVPASHRFPIGLGEVVITRVGMPADHLVIETWHPGHGVRRIERRSPARHQHITRAAGPADIRSASEEAVSEDDACFRARGSEAPGPDRSFPEGVQANTAPVVGDAVVGRPVGVSANARSEDRGTYPRCMPSFPTDIFTEPEHDPDTLVNLGPLSPLAGVWEGTTGTDVHPGADGSEWDTYVERYELQPIDPQTNGPQLFYGLRYHVHITKPNDVATFHDQVGYWLWEPETGTVVQTIAIPRGQVAMLTGRAAPDATSFEVDAMHGSETYGICSNPFLDHAFRTVEVHVRVTANRDGTWTYDEDTVMKVLGRDELFHHTDRHTLTRALSPTPNPVATNGS